MRITLGVIIGLALQWSGVVFAADQVDFGKEVYPLFKEKCIQCHGPEKQKGDLRWDTAEGIAQSKADEVIIPGNVENSELINRITLPSDDLDAMPPEGEGEPLTEKEVDLVKQWVAQGAEWSQPVGVNLAGGSGEIDYQRDIKPILNELSERERELITVWAKQGGKTPVPSQVKTQTGPKRTRSGLQALYDFQSSSGSTVRDRSGVGEPADLKIADMNAVRRSEGSLEVRGNTVIQSEEAPSKIIDAVGNTGEITIEAWLWPADTGLDGPARIVTLSENSGARNFTLGQQKDQFDVRFRTTETSGNGIPSLSSREGSLKTELTHVVYTRDQTGRTRIYINGELSNEETVAGAPSNWNSSHRLALANELSGDRPWRGTYHLVAIYNRDLLPREVTAHYEAGADAEVTLAAGIDTPQMRLFHTEIAPLFSRHCLECHDSATQKGDLDLTRKTPALTGGEDAVIIPGNASESRLWELVEADKMPDEREPLTDREKQLLKRWIDAGADWPVEVIDPTLYTAERETPKSWLRRLTISEYIETVRSAVGVDIAEKARELLPADLRADGFRNTAYNLNVDLGHVEAYARLAEIIVDRMDVVAYAMQYADNKRLTDNNMRALVQEMGKWLLRGPLNETEINTFRGISTTVASAGGDFEEAVSYILEAMLQSPRFLYRIENQRGDGTPWPVGDYELASRMSYIIWGGPPDKELMEAVDAGKLYDRNGIERQVRRMLQDPRAVERSTQFVHQWLNLDRLETLQPNTEHFPEWSDQLAKDMRKETKAFFEFVAWVQERPLADLMNAEVTFATPQLADYYGLDPKNEEELLTRYDLTSAQARGGLLTQGSVLTVGGEEASTVARGLFVLRDILGGSVKDPPPCVDTTPVPSKPGESKREIAEARIANPSCGGCHSKFEPLAFGLEKFDGLGGYQERDKHGNKLRDDGEILFPGSAEPISYESSAEMMDLLAGSERVSKVMTRKVTQFALGRPLVPADAPAIEKIHEAAQQGGGTYESLITAIVTSDLVQMIRTETD